MKLWRLEPVKPLSRNWKASTYKGEVIVRAESELEARQIASSAYCIATKVVPGEKVRINPWHYAVDTVCIEYDGHDYDESGKTEIVGPGAAIKAKG